MTKVDIFSGFLGAGKTTLIKKLISEAFKGEKLVLIENEFGEIGIDGGFLKESGIEISEMNSGCICCTLVGDFGVALHKVIEQYSPDRIIIEPSGVGKLSDVIKAVTDAAEDTDLQINSFIAVVDASKCKMYMKNFGEFFNNQIEYAKTIIFSRTQKLAENKLEEAMKLVREHNDKAVIITTPWDELDGAVILKAMEEKNRFEDELLEQAGICPECGHHHDHHHDCCEHEHHDHDHEHEHHHDCREHEHHDHDHHHDCCEHEHEHDHHHEHHHDCCEHEHHDHDHHHDCCEHEHHDHDHDHEHEHDCCGHDHEHHHDHHHHHADEVFASVGIETTRKYTEEGILDALNKLEDEETYGVILRAKGIVASTDDEWIHFDYVPGESEVRRGPADVIGRICVIGSKIDEAAIKALF